MNVIWMKEEMVENEDYKDMVDKNWSEDVGIIVLKGSIHTGTCSIK